MPQSINTDIRAALIEGKNKNKARDFTDILGDVINEKGFCKKLDTNLQVVDNDDGTITIKKGSAFVKYTKTSGDEGFVKCELGEDKTLDISGEADGTYFVSFKLNQDVIDNGSQSVSGDDVFSIEFDTSEYDYTICQIDKSGTDYTITDKRDTIKLGKLQVNGISLEDGILNIDTKLTIGSQEIIENTDGELEASGTIKATAFKGDGSGLSNVNALPYIFGDGSDGDLIITSGTTNLNLNQVYQFSSINISSGAVLSTNDVGGNMYIKCNGDCIIDGDIDLVGKVGFEQKLGLLDFDITIGNGGNGGDGGDAEGNLVRCDTTTSLGGNGGKYGGGGGGGGKGGAYDDGSNYTEICFGGAGGDGTYIGGLGGDGVYGSGDGGDSYSNNGGDSVITTGSRNDSCGNNGGYSAGGSGGYKSDDSTDSYGAGGGGGAGGGTGGVLLLYSYDITLNGNIYANGGNGGDGGDGACQAGSGASAGGGGAGGGGAGGFIVIGSIKEIDLTNVDINGGLGGTGGLHCSSGGDDGTDGLDGTGGDIGQKKSINLLKVF